MCLSLQILMSSRITWTQWKLPHLELCRPSRIANPFWRCWIFFCKLCKLRSRYPFNKIKTLWWTTIALEKSFQLMYSNTHLKFHETIPLSKKKSSVSEKRSVSKIWWNTVGTQYLPTDQSTFHKFNLLCQVSKNSPKIYNFFLFKIAFVIWKDVGF